MQKENKKSLSCRKVFIRHLRIFVSDGTVNERKEIRRSRITNFRDDRSLFNNGNAFTLIELLVVVLIIGILAAVAVPQYQKAVEKSKSVQALTMLRTVYNASEAYYLANGTPPTSFDELGVDIPWTRTADWSSLDLPSRANADWTLQLYNSLSGQEPGVAIARLKGKYKGSGFMIYLSSAQNSLPKGKPICVERVNGSINFTAEEGSYCQQIMKGTWKSTFTTLRWYELP